LEEFMVACRSSMLAGAGVLMVSCALAANPAYADTVKPPIRGLVSMGAYRFVSIGGQPVNTMAPLNKKPGIFGGIVVVPSWQQLQPKPNGPLVSTVIDRMLTQIRAYNTRHPTQPLAVKLRVWGGFMAPAWAKRIGGAPITATHSGHVRTVGRFWSPAYRAAFANLQKLLAAKYDSEPLIREVSVTQCMSFTAEPFFVPTSPTEDVITKLRAAGFNDADFKSCLTNAVSDYAPWKQSRIVLSVNPYRTAPRQGNGDAAFTERVMAACRKAIGVRCVFDNHDLDSNLAASLLPIYADMKKLGPEIEFQTAATTPKNFPGTIKFGVAYGASSIELYQDFGGFPLVPNGKLKNWASWIAVNTGAAKK
jgi:hypothetical protein